MQALTLERLIEDCREELDDAVEPYLWSDKLLTRYLNEAVAEAAIRTRCIVETGQPLISQIEVKAGQASYTLHPSVVVVRQALLASEPREPLVRTESQALDGHRCDWRTETGTPRYFLRDQMSRLVRLVPAPIKDDTLVLTLWRTPADVEEMEDPLDEPAIDSNYHGHLIRWACFRALNKRDVEQQSTNDADRNLAMFEQFYGARPTMRQLQALQIDPVTGNAAVWF